MAWFFNTAFSLSMVNFPADETGKKQPVAFTATELAIEEAATWLGAAAFNNVANPSHANTLAAVTQRLGIDVMQAEGGRVVLNPGDQLLVAQVSFPPVVPRETTEYTDEQLALGRFSFILVEIA